MSESTSPALGSRENYFAVDDERYEGDDQPAGHVEKTGVNREAFIAAQILRRAAGARLLCPHCWHELEDDDRREVELTDPLHYVAPSEVEIETEADDDPITERRYTDHRRHRRCPQCSQVVWGGVLADRPREELLAVVDEVLEVFDVAPSTAEKLRLRAAERKQRGLSDESTDSDDYTASERFKLWRMDLASGLDADSLVWRFLLPVGTVLAVELIIVRFWVAWWLYPPLLAVAILAGIGFYQGTSWYRARRLASLRESVDGEYWDEVSVLVKTVDTDELTVYMGFLAGHTYASTDRDRLVEVLSSRALERCQGYQPSPAIEERYAWCLRRYLVNFTGWRENREKPAIMDALVNEVLDSSEGLLPKQELADRVIEHDRRYIWRGLRFVGLGHDPELVAECYEDLVPNTLVEREVAAETADGVDTITAVRARTETLPPDVATVRASFSERFPTHKIPDRYELRSVEIDEQTTGFVQE